MKQMVPSTNDVYMVLRKIFNNQDLNELSYEEIIISFKNELSNYLLNKLLFFNLDHINYTIDNDINLILDTMDELIDSDKKYDFFYFINDCIIKLIQILIDIEVKWVEKNDITLLGGPIIVKDGEESYQVCTYDKDNPVDITKHFIDLVNSLEPTMKQKENALAPIWRQ